MKKVNLLTWALISSVAFFSSCSKSDDEHCDGCHITILGADGTDSLAWHITNADGTDRIFCGDELHNAEESWTIAEGDSLIEENGGVSLPAGTYTHLVDGYEIHCHED